MNKEQRRYLNKEKEKRTIIKYIKEIKRNNECNNDNSDNGKIV